MKTRNILIAVGLVAVLLLGTAVVAGAEPEFIRVTGGGNWTYYSGWAWGQMNVTFDPATGEADGFFKYKSYTEVKPKNWGGGWVGEAICADLGEFMGMPAVSVVVEVVGGDYWEYGTYAKFILADGGNDSEDWAGLVVWGEEGPVAEMPGCEYADPFYAWPNENGNFTIHFP